MAAAAAVVAGAAAGGGRVQRPSVRLTLHTLADPARRHLPLALPARRTRHHIDLLQGLLLDYD